MAEPLKNSFGPDVPVRIAAMIGHVYPDFDDASFVRSALEGYEELELTPRARHISEALADYLPADWERALGIVIDALDPEIIGDKLTGMASFSIS